MSAQPIQGPTDRRRGLLATAALACLILVLSAATAAPAQDLQSQLDAKQAQLDQANEKEGVLSTDIEEVSDQIDQLAGEVATLRNREAIVQERLNRVQAQLVRSRKYLNELRDRLFRSRRVLKHRLVSIYKSDEPDALTVIL